jgi:hypothetical protein
MGNLKWVGYLAWVVLVILGIIIIIPGHPPVCPQCGLGNMVIGIISIVLGAIPLAGLAMARNG